ncbi:16S rRNA (cytosine(1402)-N(4))-methyltransferase RsmH [Planctomicrobium sp.]|mgnify:FL=1|jgi:16S rRNA (cytosine1402-N4)-methyltransferase|nr:16S rRNA (cytosine(1402)-N(4))-methyltransferase RsmH [Planctomicrobium sp.]MDB4742915.1 16S rRNA (cytosine(1402)-N(4))-methyltransferase RsmH [Planctomicrobium sp.]
MPRPTSSHRTVHVPVMLHEVLDQLAIEPNLTILDGTLGAGGHSSHILKAMNTQGRLIGLDRDQSMIDRASQIVNGPNVSLHQASYAQIVPILDSLEIPQFDRVLLDLGLSSDQLADANRGFGFDTSGTLDMRFDETEGQSAADFLQSASEAEIEAVLSNYGEEKAAANIAHEIHKQRRSGNPIRTADQLVELVERVTGPTNKKKSPSVARVFQALRIAVNRELDQLDNFLYEILPTRLSLGGRAVIITFHSLEDRMVKDAFRNTEVWNNLTRKPLAPTPSEIRNNPRSRSAKLRVAERIK